MGISLVMCCWNICVCFTVQFPSNTVQNDWRERVPILIRLFILIYLLFMLFCQAPVHVCVYNMHTWCVCQGLHDSHKIICVFSHDWKRARLEDTMTLFFRSPVFIKLTVVRNAHLFPESEYYWISLVSVLFT